MEEKARQLIQSGIIFGPVPKSKIVSAEKELGVKFPSEYREFLQKFGSVLFNGWEIYGLPKQDVGVPPMWQDVMQATRTFRGQIGLMEDDQFLIPISDNGMDCTYLLNTKKSPNTEIIVWGPAKIEPVASSLADFIVWATENS